MTISGSELEDVEITSKGLKDIKTCLQENHIGFQENNGKQDWITTEILELVNKRKKMRLNTKNTVDIGQM